MTLLGKLLVFLNLVVSAGFLTWSLGLYTERPDWFAATNESGEKVDGRFTRLKNEVTALTAVTAANAKRWGDGLHDLEAKETLRADRQAKLAARLKVARNGVSEMDPTGFFEPTYQPDGLLDLAAAQTTAEKGPDDLPLRASGRLQSDFDANVTAIGVATKKSGELRGNIPLPPNDPNVKNNQKDFRRPPYGSGTEHLQKQLVLLTDIRGETEYLRRFRVNWDAQLDTVLRRKAQLDTAIKRLEPFQ